MIEKKQLFKRLVSSSLLVAVAVYAVFFSPGWLFCVFLELFVVTGLIEYFNLAERKGFPINRYLGLTFGMLMPITNYFAGEAVILTDRKSVV